MVHVLLSVAVGGPGGPRPAPSWDWWPLAGIVLVLVIGWRYLGLWLTLPLFIGSIAGGLVFAWWVHAWGVLPALTLSLVVLVVLRTLGPPRPRRREPPDPSSEV